MIIECPFCHARAKISEMQEGAKVRCGECGKVYVARQVGKKRASSSNNTGYLVAGIVGLVAIVGLGMIMSGGNDGPQAGGSNLGELITEREDPDAAALEAELRHDYSNPAVQEMVALHQAIERGQDNQVLAKLDLERAWARLNAGDEDGPELPEDWPSGDSFAALTGTQRQRVSEFLVNDITAGPLGEYLREWVPFDGRVAGETDDGLTIELYVRPKEGNSASSRTIEWQLVRSGTTYLIYDWRRHLTTEEERALWGRRPRGTSVVELSDGSRVLEREPEPLAHLEDTPPELRERIDRLFATMIDLNLTREATAAQRELVEIGRPAIPTLLTGLYELPLNTVDDAIQVNMVDQALQQITGKDFGYAPMVAVGSGAGTTEERRTSAIRQWFAWWYRSGDRFQEAELEDALEDHLEMTPEDERFHRLSPDN